MILGIVDDIIDAITGMIGNFLFGLLGGIFFMFIDWVQGLFRSLAGLGPIKIDGKLVNNVEGGRQDLVWWLIQTDVVQDVFWSLVTFSLILMFLMTGLAIIRNAYQDKPKPIGDIIGGVFKGLLGMILLPIACMVGLMFGNIILLAVDKGTSASGATTLSGTLFISAAYDANIARDPWDDDDTGFFSGLTTREERYQAFLLNSNFEEYLKKNGGDKYTSINPDSNWSEDEWNEVADFIDNAFVTGQIKDGFGIPLTLYTAGNVSWCYRTWSISYLVLVVGGCIMLGFLFKMCFGMIGRLFKLTIDFVMIPVVMAMMPFDTKPSQSWKGDFVKNTTLAYTTVGVMNIYFSILPIVNKIEFNGANGFFLNIVLKLILTIVGLFSAESIISSVGGWFGTGDLLKEGASVQSIAKSKLLDPAKKAVGTTGKFVGAGMAAKKDGGSFWKGGFAGTAGAALNKRAGESALWKGMSEGGKTYKEQKEAGGVFTDIGTEERKKALKNQATTSKNVADLMEEANRLGLKGKEKEEFITGSSLGKKLSQELYAKENQEAATKRKSVEKKEKSLGSIDALNEEQERLGNLESLIGSEKYTALRSPSDDVIGEYMKTGVISEKLQKAIDEAGDNKDAAMDALKDLRGTSRQITGNMPSTFKALMSEKGDYSFKYEGKDVDEKYLDGKSNEELKQIYDKMEIVNKNGEAVKRGDALKEIQAKLTTDINRANNEIKITEKFIEDSVKEDIEFIANAQKKIKEIRDNKDLNPKQKTERIREIEDKIAKISKAANKESK